VLLATADAELFSLETLPPAYLSFSDLKGSTVGPSGSAIAADLDHLATQSNFPILLGDSLAVSRLFKFDAVEIYISVDAADPGEELGRFSSPRPCSVNPDAAEGQPAHQKSKLHTSTIAGQCRQMRHSMPGSNAHHPFAPGWCHLCCSDSLRGLGKVSMPSYHTLDLTAPPAAALGGSCHCARADGFALSWQASGRGGRSLSPPCSNALQAATNMACAWHC
jgi:hypothetical protein